MTKQIKSKKRVKDFAEVFTAEREVKAMCDLLPEDMFSDITKTFLEPACGEGAFLLEIFSRKLRFCKEEKDGLKALNSLFGIDIQADNVCATQRNLVDMYLKQYPNASEFAILLAWQIVTNNIACDNFLDPTTERAKKWGVSHYEEIKKNGGKKK